ncbi:hypothetical protein M9458_006296, partial [Cirrhinus mrigala]
HTGPTPPSHMSTASTPSRPTGIPLSSVLPVMAIAILSVWATHCAPEASSDHKSMPEASPVQECAPMPPEVSAYAVDPPKEAASIHELTATSDYEFAPIPPEVSACTVEPPKEVASINELTATSDYEFAPMPPEVVAPAAEPPKVAASSYELSACHVTAKKANHEPYALLWLSIVPLWISLLLSALPALSALPWLPALPAPPWLQAPPNQTWWITYPSFHCLLLLHGPGPPVLHCLSLLSHPLFYLCSPTLLESLLEGIV